MLGVYRGDDPKVLARIERRNKALWRLFRLREYQRRKAAEDDAASPISRMSEAYKQHVKDGDILITK